MIDLLAIKSASSVWVLVRIFFIYIGEVEEAVLLQTDRLEVNRKLGDLDGQEAAL